MSDEREESIRRRAYELWEQGGGDHGRDHEHWHQATGEVDGAGNPPAGALAPDGTTIGEGADTTGAEGDGGNGASIVEAEVTEPVAPAAPAKAAPAQAAVRPAAKAAPAARPRKPKTK